MAPHISTDPPELLFLVELEKALERERLRLSDDAHAYLTRLLSRIRTESGPPLPQDPLSGEFLTALGALDERQRIILLRRVGDSALLASGWWWQFLTTLRHGMPGEDFHAELGKQAYRRIQQELFDELADKFFGLVDVLARMSGALGGESDRETMKLLDYWLRSNSRQAARLLAEHGIDVLGIDSRPRS